MEHKHINAHADKLLAQAKKQLGLTDHSNHTEALVRMVVALNSNVCEEALDAVRECCVDRLK